MSGAGFDWTRVSDDPNDPRAKAEARALLPTLRRIHMDVDLTGLVEREAAGRRVLDVGVVSHAARYFDQPGWRHGRIARAAAACVGIDILAPLVEELVARGFDVRCVDATSEADLGERFDLVFLGDIMEHVESPAALLRFARRHLAADGRILAATPNPFSRKFLRQFFRQGVMVTNLDHVAWFSPTMALELARRCGLELAAYHMAKPVAPGRRWLKRLAWRLRPAEFAFADLMFEFRLPRGARAEP